MTPNPIQLGKEVMAVPLNQSSRLAISFAYPKMPGAPPTGARHMKLVISACCPTRGRLTCRPAGFHTAS